MPNLYPGSIPLFHRGGRSVCFLVTLLLPVILAFPNLVTAQPAISSVSPLSGAVGTTVTITGSNFGATSSANIVRFGTVQAPVTAATSTSLTVTAPAGTSNLPITVTTGGLTAYFYTPFSASFADSGQFIPSAFASRTDYATGNGPQSLAVMDMDGDGKPDLVVADGDSDAIEIYLNTGTPGSMAYKMVYKYVLPLGYYPVCIATGDLDGDGKPDIAVSNGTSPYLTVFLNTSTTGAISMAAPVILPQGNYATGAIIGDLNGDGKPEIVVTNLADDTVAIYPNTSTVGTLSFGPLVKLALPSGTLPTLTTIADFDGDGMPDLATVNGGPGSVSIFRNTGTAGGALSFSANNDFLVGNYPQSLFAADLDGDGKPDIAVANNSDNTISLLHNTSTSGSIAFVKGPDLPVGNGPQSIIVSDFDGDGKPDVAVADLSDDSVAILRNRSTSGTITMAAPISYRTNYGPYWLAAGDLDGDGMPDLAVVDNTANMVSVLRNVSPSSTTPSITSFQPTTGSTGTIVTVIGYNFTGATSLSFGGTAASGFTVVSADTIRATVAGGASGAVSVMTAAGTASLNGFTYGLPQPVITSFLPASGTTGSTIQLRGSGLTGVTAVNFGGVAAASFTIQSDSVITAVVASGATGPIALTAPGGNYTTTASFTYTTPQPLALNSFTPTSGTTGTIVYLKGVGLSANPVVSFGSVTASNVTILSDTLIAATVASGASGEVVVTTTSGTDSLPGFTYTASAPPPPANITITNFSPTSAPAGTAITISGTNLSGATGVSFGGVSAITFTVMSSTEIIAVVGNGATGMVTVASPTSADSLSGFVFQYDTTRQSKPPAVFLLEAFTGVLNSNKPELQWTTVNDRGVSYYAVERGADSMQFTVIATVKSIGTDTMSHTYTYTDPNPIEGINYYRIRVQDTTALFLYSSTIALQPLGMLMPVYPNPVKYGFFYVDLPVTALPSELRLADLSGKVRQVIEVPAGQPQVIVDVSRLIPGAYGLSWSNGAQSAYQTILILRK